MQVILIYETLCLIRLLCGIMNGLFTNRAITFSCKIKPIKTSEFLLNVLRPLNPNRTMKNYVLKFLPEKKINFI